MKVFTAVGRLNLAFYTVKVIKSDQKKKIWPCGQRYEPVLFYGRYEQNLKHNRRFFRYFSRFHHTRRRLGVGASIQRLESVYLNTISHQGQRGDLLSRM